MKARNDGYIGRSLVTIINKGNPAHVYTPEHKFVPGENDRVVYNELRKHMRTTWTSIHDLLQKSSVDTILDAKAVPNQNVTDFINHVISASDTPTFELFGKLEGTAREFIAFVQKIIGDIDPLKIVLGELENITKYSREHPKFKRQVISDIVPLLIGIVYQVKHLMWGSICTITQGVILAAELMYRSENPTISRKFVLFTSDMLSRNMYQLNKDNDETRHIFVRGLVKTFGSILKEFPEALPSESEHADLLSGKRDAIEHESYTATQWYASNYEWLTDVMSQSTIGYSVWLQTLIQNTGLLTSMTIMSVRNLIPEYIDLSDNTKKAFTSIATHVMANKVPENLKERVQNHAKNATFIRKSGEEHAENQWLLESTNTRSFNDTRLELWDLVVKGLEGNSSNADIVKVESLTKTLWGTSISEIIGNTIATQLVSDSILMDIFNQNTAQPAAEEIDSTYTPPPPLIGNPVLDILDMDEEKYTNEQIKDQLELLDQGFKMKRENAKAAKRFLKDNPQSDGGELVMAAKEYITLYGQHQLDESIDIRDYLRDDYIELIRDEPIFINSNSITPEIAVAIILENVDVLTDAAYGVVKIERKILAFEHILKIRDWTTWPIIKLTEKIDELTEAVDKAEELAKIAVRDYNKYISKREDMLSYLSSEVTAKFKKTKEAFLDLGIINDSKNIDVITEARIQTMISYELNEMRFQEYVKVYAGTVINQLRVKRLSGRLKQKDTEDWQSL